MSATTLFIVLTGLPQFGGSLSVIDQAELVAIEQKVPLVVFVGSADQVPPQAGSSFVACRVGAITERSGSGVAVGQYQAGRIGRWLWFPAPARRGLAADSAGWGCECGDACRCGGQPCECGGGSAASQSRLAARRLFQFPTAGSCRR